MLQTGHHMVLDWKRHPQHRVRQLQNLLAKSAFYFLNLPTTEFETLGWCTKLWGHLVGRASEPRM
jgi:hypothetical protein